MEEIKVGEYIRTIDGYIRKVMQINKKGTYEALCYGAYSVDEKYKNSIGVSAKKVKSHSPNIIDLIEEGDILLIEISREWTDDEYRQRIIAIGPTFTKQEIIKNIDDGLYLIKQILTKEQFESGSYKVEE